MADFPRVVVTGIGMVTPVGLDVPSSWSALLAGKSGTGPITHFDASDCDVQVAGEVKGFVPEDLMDRRTARRSGRHTQMAVVAAAEAVKSANLTVDDSNRDSIGVIIASSGALQLIGEQEIVAETRGIGRVDPLTVPRVGQYSTSVRVGRLMEVRGPNSSVNSACASGGDAIGQALNMLRLGHADCMVAGGAESMIGRVVVSSLAGLGALAKTWNHKPEQASRPFDANRSGFVLGEGAGLLVLETEEFAVRRGAPIICELAGAAWSFDATDDTAPDVDGQALAMQRALKDAGLTMDDVSYINAHGTSTQLNDKTETAAIKKVFGERAYGIAISSTKSMTGHLAAAAGAVEAAIGVLTIRDQTIAPTINYETPDPNCDLDYVPLKARKAEVNVVLSNAFGLGGQNTCLVLKRYTSRTAMSYVAWMNEGKLPREQVGGKGASLSNLAASGFNVPLGFCVTADAYRYFSASNGLDAKIEAIMRGIDASQPASVAEGAKAIEALVAEAPLPDDLCATIREAYTALMARQDMACAVRSSAISEDGSAASFAGLYETYLNVRGEQDILDRLHKCYVSLWAERAVGYRARNGGGHDEAMAVVVMGLVPAETAGIAFTAHPVTGALDTVVINASWGLGEAIVSGRVTPDCFFVTKGSWQIQAREIYPKTIATHPDGDGTIDAPVERARQTLPSLTDEEVTEVARLATQVEEHYGSPQDIEWALADGRLYLLQSRPITTL